MSRPIEFKGSAGVKDIDSVKRTVMFYASKFGNQDADRDTIQPGSYAKTIAENGPTGKNRIYHLAQHKTDKILGKPHIIKEDAYGLYCETNFPDTELGDEYLKLYQAGVLSEHSVGIQVLKAMYPEGEGWDKPRIITEVKLWEVSTVTWGANEQANFIGTKSERKQKAFNYMDNIIKSLHKGSFRDETFELLEFELKKVQSFIHSLEIEEPQESTQKQTNEPDLLERMINTFNKSALK